ncbi:hypothetical protein TELCIR_04839 [Teladorsagia circumcincta]|uniref:Channel protein, hemolysin III family n=1 Tax=Teladorsagia circumcincta TaxID=45464 RepID=A0A2G9USF1_TELCI|nr:hypothetical protein TELCIR_04839 [Teladorsagia circumcincta]
MPARYPYDVILEEMQNERDVVVVYDDGDLKNREDSDSQSPMRSVDSILREAENIMTDGPMRASGNKENQQVILDEVDVEYSPKKSSHPIEIVVRHSKVVEQPREDSDEGDDENSANESKRLSTLVEGQEAESQKASSSSSNKGNNAKWTRGHRRAWSMPNAKGEKMTLAIVQDKETMVEINEEEVVVPGESGCVAFIGVALWFLTRPTPQIQFMEKVVFSLYFLGAILCLGMSFIFHTVACHSDTVGKLFSKLDYAGIALLIVGSFIPWLYYAFYCRPQPMVIYITMISVLGLLAMIVSLWDKFSEPAYRPLRAIIFVAMGLSAVFPAAHLLFVDGVEFLYTKASLVWMLLMGFMYISGAAIYATRIPERWFPGRCDLWFQSHQLFHTFVVIAAFIHFHSITEMAKKKLMEGSCAEQLLERYGIESHPSYLGGWLGLDEDPNIISWNGV